MTSIQQGLKLVKRQHHALITPLVPHRMWEISIPKLERTTYAQTGLILSRGQKFDTLTDNGTTNNGKAFNQTHEIWHQLHRYMIKYNVALSGNEYYTCQFIRGSSKTLLRRINDMVDFLTNLDKIIKQHT